MKLFFLLPELFSQSCQDPCQKKVPNKQSKSNADKVELSWRNKMYIIRKQNQVKGRKNAIKFNVCIIYNKMQEKVYF